MADPGYAKSLIRPLGVQFRKALEDLIEYMLGNLRFGRCEDATRATNLQLYAFDATTHATPGTEFSIAHGLKSAPYLLVPILSLQDVGAKLVPLEVSRAADEERIYLKSTVASAPIRVLVEV